MDKDVVTYIDSRIEENALTILLQEFKEEREDVRVLKKQVSDLTARVQFLESKLQNA